MDYSKDKAPIEHPPHINYTVVLTDFYERGLQCVLSVLAPWAAVTGDGYENDLADCFSVTPTVKFASLP